MGVLRLAFWVVVGAIHSFWLLVHVALFLAAAFATLLALLVTLNATTATPLGVASGCLAFALLMLQYIRMNSELLPIFALRDSGAAIVCRRSVLPSLAFFFALMGLVISATQSYLETGWSTGTVIWLAAAIAISLALANILMRLRRPLTIDAGGVDDAGLRGGKIALDTIRDSHVRHIHGTPLFIVLSRRDAPPVWLLALDLPVTAESVVDAINRRITGAHSK